MRHPPTNSPAAQLRLFHMSLLKLGVGATSAPTTKEMAMDMFAGMPEWWAWVAAGAVGAIALAALANMLAAAFDLDAG